MKQMWTCPIQQQRKNKTQTTAFGPTLGKICNMNWSVHLLTTLIIHDLMRNLQLVVLVRSTQPNTSESWGSVITVALGNSVIAVQQSIVLQAVCTLWTRLVGNLAVIWTPSHSQHCSTFAQGSIIILKPRCNRTKYRTRHHSQLKQEEEAVPSDFIIDGHYFASAAMKMFHPLCSLLLVVLVLCTQPSVSETRKSIFIAAAGGKSTHVTCSQYHARSGNVAAIWINGQVQQFSRVSKEHQHMKRISSSRQKCHEMELKPLKPSCTETWNWQLTYDCWLCFSDMITTQGLGIITHIHSRAHKEGIKERKPINDTKKAVKTKNRKNIKGSLDEDTSLEKTSAVG